jgi:hypothetical protein
MKATLAIIITLCMLGITGMMIWDRMDHRSDAEKQMEEANAKLNSALCSHYRMFGDRNKMQEYCK